jgi:hypothetical protein
MELKCPATTLPYTVKIYMSILFLQLLFDENKTGEKST